MKYIKKGLHLLATGNFKELFLKITKVVFRVLYLIRANLEDRLIGRMSVNKKKPSRFTAEGAYATESTNYIWLDKIFASFPLKETATFLDVGCGEGRVLTYLYLRGFRGKLVGIELDPDVASTAAQRVKKCTNIQIHQGNVLDCKEIVQEATAVYLFNPFNEAVLTRFIELLEACCNHPVILYYSNDIHCNILDKRENWYILRRNILKCATLPRRRYTVYRYRPNK